MSAAVSAGLVSGPVLGGILAGAGGNFLLGIVAAIASAIGAVWILIAVPSRPPTTPETTTPETTTPETTTPENKVVKASTPTSVRLLQIVPELRSLLLVATIGWFALACLEGTFGRLIQRTLELGRLEFGFLLSVEAGVSVVQGIFFPLLARHHSYRTLLRTSYIFQAIGLCLMPFASHFVWLVLLSILFGIGLGIAGPAINGEASTQSPATRQGEVFGLLQATRAFGFLFGPILGGALFDWHIASPYLIAGGMLLGIVFFVGRGKPDTPH
jgi:MFS family permease